MTREKLTKIILIVLVVAALIGLIVAIIFRFIGEDQPVPTDLDGNPFPSSNDADLGIIDEVENEFGSQEGTEDFLLPISERPVAGYLGFEREVRVGTSTETVSEQVIRYVDRGTGNIYEYNLSNNERARLTNTTIPKSIAAHWINPEAVIVQYVNETTDPVNIILTLHEDGEEYTTESSFLPSTSFGFARNPDGSSFIYFIPASDGSVGYEYSLENGTQQELFQLPFREFTTSWGSIFTVTTKPSSRTPGYMYRIDMYSGNLSKVLGPVQGLITLPSPEGTEILYSSSSAETRLSLFNASTGTVAETNLKGLASKCAWLSVDTVLCGAEANLVARGLPDTWHKGEVLFRDSIYTLNTSANLSEFLLTPSLSSDFTRVSAPFGVDVLLFVNKHDLRLYAIQSPLYVY